MDPDDPRLFYPAAERNREPILEVLARVLPSGSTVLEIASGSGQHAAHFAAHLSGVTWQPSDADEALLPSIRAWTADLPAVRAPIVLDVEDDPWPALELSPFDAFYNANMIHIAPWTVCLGLLRGAGAHLRDGGLLVLYGPFRIEGAHTAESNARFDASLRQRDPRFGVRDLEAVCNAAAEVHLHLQERVPMPANNQTVVFRKQRRERT